MTRTLFTEANLRAGLDTFTKPGVSRYEKALEHYNTAIKNGITQRVAIDKTLEEAVATGLKDKEAKLKTARTAAGITPIQRVQNAAQPLATAATKVRNLRSRKSPAVAVVQTEATSTGTIVSYVVIGALLGCLVALILNPIMIMLYSNKLGHNPGSFLEIVVLVATICLFALLAYRFALRAKPRTTTTISTNPADLNLPHNQTT